MSRQINKVNIIGCGYLGKKLIFPLLEKNIDFDCFVQSEISQVNCIALGGRAHQFDLNKSGLCLDESKKSLLSESVLIYLAPPQNESNFDKRMQNFILWLSLLTTSPLKMILISTTGVYGNCEGEWIDESRPTNPQVDRAKRRLSAENQLKKYCDGVNIPFIIFRVAGIYAADKLPIKRIMSGEPIVCTKESGYTNRIHADDLSAFCVEAITEEVEPGIYNVCDGEPSTMNDYFMKAADALKLNRPAEISLLQAQKQLSKGMLSYLAESKRVSNKKLLANFKTPLKYKNLLSGLNLA